MLEMFHCCTDALLFFMVVFKRFVIVLPFEHAKNMFYSNKGKKWLRWGREQQHAPSIQHIQILWNKKKNFFSEKSKQACTGPLPDPNPLQSEEKTPQSSQYVLFFLVNVWHHLSCLVLNIYLRSPATTSVPGWSLFAFRTPLIPHSFDSPKCWEILLYSSLPPTTIPHSDSQWGI